MCWCVSLGALSVPRPRERWHPSSPGPAFKPQASAPSAGAQRAWWRQIPAQDSSWLEWLTRHTREEGVCLGLGEPSVSHSVVSASLGSHELQPTRLLCPWDFPGLEQVAFPFSRGSSWPRDQTQVSCVSGRFFTGWATREILNSSLTLPDGHQEKTK